MVESGHSTMVPERIRNVFRSFKYRNYRLFFAGQGISLIGTWVQRTALPWFVYTTTGSPFLLGLVSFASWVPAIVLSPLAGAMIDRWDRYKVLVITQVLSMVQALFLSVLYFTGLAYSWAVIALSLFLGCINAFDVPARQSFVIDMVDDRKDLGNAIALNSSLFNGARLIGPSIAGVMIALTNEGICFLVNAASFVFVISSLLAMRPRERERRHGKADFLSGMLDGFKYAFGLAPLRYTIVLLAVISLIGMPFTVLMPVIASEVLNGDSHTFGFLMGALGLGALLGALYLASRKDTRGLWRVMTFSVALFSLGFFALAVSNHFLASLTIVFAMGIGMILTTASSNTLIQTVVEEDKRARVMGFYSMAMLGAFPIGCLLVGAMADLVGVAYTLVACGSLCLLGALFFSIKLGSIMKKAEVVQAGHAPYGP